MNSRNCPSCGSTRFKRIRSVLTLKPGDEQPTVTHHDYTQGRPVYRCADCGERVGD